MDRHRGGRARSTRDARPHRERAVLNGGKNRWGWGTYSGGYTGQGHSPLKQITPENAHRLSPQWTFQTDTTARGRGFEATPLIVDGVLYSTGPNGFAWALDART